MVVGNFLSRLRRDKQVRTKKNNRNPHINRAVPKEIGVGTAWKGEYEPCAKAHEVPGVCRKTCPELDTGESKVSATLRRKIHL